MNNAAGIGKQVLGELSGVAKKVAKDTIKVGGDIAKGTVEMAVGGGASLQDNNKMKQAEQIGGGSVTDPLQVAKQQARIKKQRSLRRVREELAAYVKRKKQLEDQKNMAEERHKEAEKQEKAQRQETEREMLINQARRRGGGTGELVRKKH